MKEINQLICKKSYEYLISILPPEISCEELDKYFIGDNKNFSSLEDVFERFIISCQNYRGMPKSIKYCERRDKIKLLLHDYDLEWVSSQKIEDLFKIFYDEYKVKLTNPNIKYNSWYKWSHSIIDSAKFLLDFKNVDEFKGFVEQFNFNLTISSALPLLLSIKISGMGFALACDALKELGYVNYVKPDTHIIDICYELNLCDNRDQFEAFETMIKIVDDGKKIDNTLTPYKLDKIFWLICSGNYYMDDVYVKGHKKDFIEMLNKEILSLSIK